MKIEDALPRGITDVFALMGIAEEEIACAKEREGPKTEAGQRIQQAFEFLFPGRLIGLDSRVYRHHCRELLARVVNQQDLTLATVAECLELLSDASFTAPPKRDYAALFGRLFSDVMGQEMGVTDESYPGACDEILARMRVKHARGYRAKGNR